ncbi:MAG: aminotransferase class III-fold pyridoxal phosphate-dependent enzyme, partial [Silvanigrellales bacterium]|nr:aminotransferase class III-fold pyridoxal phosphate-dependent enzyme [Silvanigrellales bacterium]
GQGATLRGAATDAYETDAVFRKALDRMLAATHTAGGALRVSLREFLLAPWDAGRVPVDTDIAQVALFTIQIALAEAWRERGLLPALVLGHSVGEFAAAVCAGLLSPEAGLKIVLARGKLMQDVQDEGAMAAIFASEDVVRALVSAMPKHVRERIDVTTLNGPELTCVGGHAHDVAHFVSKAGAMGLRTQPLAVNRGFHSPHMDSILEAFERTASTILDNETGNSLASKIPFLSSSDLSLHNDSSSLGAAYWRDHARQPTRFWPAVEKALAEGIDTFVEIGPDASLAALLRRGFRDEPARSERVFATFEKSTPRALGPVTTAARLWVNGARFDWAAAFPRRVPADALTALPPTALARKRHWYATMPKPQMPQHAEQRETPTMTTARKNENVLGDLTEILASLLGKKGSEVKPDASLLELGADSLVLMDALKVVEDKYGVNIPVARMFQDLSTTRSLASFLAENCKETLPSAPVHSAHAAHSSPAASLTLVPSLATHQALPSLAGIAPVSGAGGDVVSLIQTQLSLMQTQLALLSGGAAAPSAFTEAPTERPSPIPSPTPAASEEAPMKDRFNAMMPERTSVVAPLEPRKQAHLDALVSAFTTRTKGSKELTQNHRKVLAENRASAGFRIPLKEMVYPIVVEKSLGAHLWDVDGNRYVDVTMGFGVNLFGHNEPFLRQAIEAQLEKGMAVGPQSHLAGEVARLFTTLTGMERVAFTNSGTEAVMTAVRLARAGTGRKTIVLFANSYHGTFDGILARSKKSDPARKGSPVAPGIPQGLVDDVVVLDYGTDEALAHIERLGRSVAAVLVEPVQSRNPHIQPGEFLQALRDLTRRNGTALIFDEVITGLRTAQGGAQEVFNVRADIATYGKVLGGGMPIGAVAGSADFLDALDGGFWRYGDASVPPKELTFFAGTFCKHPLAMASARATLENLLAGGGSIQSSLNARVAALCLRLNAFFLERGYSDLRLAHFGSLFRFVFQGNLDLLFYHLNLRGVYVWEGRNLFLSTAHSDSDVAAIEDAIKQSLLALEEGGYLVAQQTPTSPHFAVEEFALSGPQRRFATLTQASADGHMAAVIPVTLRFRQQPNLNLLEQALESVQKRHDSLRLRFSPNFTSQILKPNAPLAKVTRVDLQELPSADRWTEVKKFLVEEARRPFELATEPPLRATAIAVYENEIVLALCFHHTVCDGLGAARVLSEMAEIYSAGVEGRQANLAPVFPFTQTLAAHPAWLNSHVRPQGKSLWEGLFNDILGSETLSDIPLDALRTQRLSIAKERNPLTRLEGQRAHLDVKASVVTALKKRAQESNTTLFMHLFAAWGTLVGGMTGQSRLAIPVPLAARGFKGTTDQVANWVNLMPLPLNVESTRMYSAILADVRKTMMVAYAAMDYPADEVIQWLQRSGRLQNPDAFPRVTFNLEPAPKAPKFTNAEGSLLASPVVASEFPLSVNLTEISGLLLIDADFQTCEFSKEDVMALLERYRTLLETLARDPTDHLASALVSLAGDGKDVRSTQGGTEGSKQRWKKRIANLP